jgi:hypothetical protein
MITTCPEPGRLRAWLDRETGDDADALADHLAGCAACQSTRATLDRDAATAARVLNALAGPLPTAADAEAALARLHRRREADVQSGLADLAPADVVTAATLADRVNGPAPLATTPAGPARPAEVTPTPRRRPVALAFALRRWRLTLGGLAAALALSLVLATPEGRVAAAAFLAQFRSQRLTIVTFDPSQTRQTGLFRLEHLGTVTNPRPPQSTQLASVDEASRRAGFSVLQPDPSKLPPGANTTPRVRFSPASETRLTFDKQKVREYFDSIGRKDAALPDKLHGVTLVVSLPPVVMLEYPSADSKPALMIGQAREVQVGVEGNATLEDVRAFLLGLPNLPDELARQLRSIQDWRSTLPIPIPADKISWQDTTVAGAQGYLLNDNTGLGSAIIWQKDGRILGVAGPLKANDLRPIAESLK